MIQNRSSRIASWSRDPSEPGNLAARHHVRDERRVAAQELVGVHCDRLLLVAAQLLDPLERDMIEPILAHQPLGKPLQPLPPLLIT